MALLPPLLISLFCLVCLLIQSINARLTAPPPLSGRVFREYIGAMGNNVSFYDVPVNTNVEFHFILAFAIDYTNNGSSPTNGNFSVFWEPTLTPEAVGAMKQKHKNVRMMVSLGGDSVNGKPCQFNPVSISSWVNNAVTSLTSIIEHYHLDGVDIDYEHFDYSNPHIFSSCMGELITRLKQNQVISVASIAPFDGVEHFYSQLWKTHSQVIDYVNFQFYTYGVDTTVSQYLEYYKAATIKYSGGKILASFSTDSPTGVSASVVLSACKQLIKKKGELPGIFVWCADTTMTSSVDHKFKYERQVQALLA